MPEAIKSRTLDRILDRNSGNDDEEKAFGKERQHTAQAFTLHVEWKDGRRSEGFAWAHYLGYRWADDGHNERLILIFGERALEIEGHNLGALVSEIREGKLNNIWEMPSQQVTLFQANHSDQPVISSIQSSPDVEDILKQIKGENDHDKTGHARRAQR